MPSSPNSILKAIRQLINKNTLENANQLASLAGLTLEDPNKKIEVIEHTTKKGKVIRGVVRTDLSYAEAKAIDEYTFKKDGGWFIREKHLGVDTQNESVEQASTVTPQNEPVTTLQSDTLVKDEDNNIKGLERKFKPASKKYKNPEINLEPKESAKLLKKTLTKLFPDTKFKVGIARGTAYGSVNVSWTDGASRELVKVIAEHFKGSRFNSSDDSTVYLHSLNEDGKIVDYKLSYIGLSRTYTREFLEKIKAAQHINMDGVVIVEENNSVWFKVDNEESEYTESVLNRAKALSSTSKYNFGNVPQAENDESEDFTLSSQSEAERLAKENEIKLIEQQKREAEEKARLKAQADKELNDFRLSGSSLPSDVAASYGQGDMFVTTRKQKQMPSLMQDATGLDPAIKDMVKEYYDLIHSTYIDEQLANPELEAWERKEYQQVKDKYLAKKNKLEKHLNETLSSLGIDWKSYYKQLSSNNEAPPEYKPVGENNVPSTSNALESDIKPTSTPDSQQGIKNSNDDESGQSGRLARPPVNGLDARGGSERDSSISLSENDGIGIGARGDTVVSDGAGQRGATTSNTASKSSRSSSTNEPRTPNERSRDSAIVRTSTRTGSVTQNEKEAAQLKADGTPTQWGDAANIDKALPYLLPEQRDDVAKLEKRLIEDNKNGMLFTNGTGTGKTFTGLGAVKRFANAGKKNILIVSMNDKIIRDFVKSAKSLNLDIHHLDGVTDNGKDKIVATTYANLAQNLMLGKRDWDLIVVDEAHNLMQGEKGENTNALAKLRALSGHHAGFNEWVKMRHADKDPKPVGENPETGNPIYNQDEVSAWEQFKKPLREQWQKTWAEQPKGRTKVIFLTATPFSYVKTLDWAEGYLFDFVPPKDKFSNDTETMGLAYNSGNEYERFYMDNFGYKMRTNRLTRPDGRVDVGILERKFAEKLKTEGAMSGRDLSVPFDYDRKFVLVNSEIGKEIDEGFSYLWDTKDKDGKSKYSDLLRVLNKRFDYLARLQLLEAIKAQEAIEQIKKHIALGRKVIVFHDYNEGGGSNPFVYVGGATQNDVGAVESQYEDFKRARPDLIALDLDLDAPITTLRRSFPDALLYNGRVAKGQRSKNADLFNTDSNGHNVLIAQSDAAATGISFHDTTGKHQRVIINIGMPSKPAKLRQTEGRIYRVGQASNAIQRYLTTGTNWERSTFSQKIAERAETVDNLAQGESAVVSIKDALVQAYEEAEYFEPSENDGIGGKAYDEENARINKLTPFERAKSDYWVKQKVTAKRQDREGKEWYATPEPVGLFMVNLSGAHSGDDILEPSAGDGAIGRYMPSDASVTFVEPSESLASRARMNNTNANVIVDSFESHGSNNKYDAIVMNPPFGQGGSIAIKHLVKAFEHLRDGGRVVALLPVGKMDELIVKYHEMGYFKDIYQVAEFALPSSTFKNAGTAVNTKIHVFEKHENKSDVTTGFVSKDLSHYDDIEDLFDAIENINIKPRKPRIDEALAEYGLEIYPDRSKYIITGEGLKRKDITSRLFGSYIEKNKDGDVVEKYNRSIAYLKWLKDSQIPNMAQFNNGLSANNLPIKYQGQVDKYNTWDGVGDMPVWLSVAMRVSDVELEYFAVEKPVYDSIDDKAHQAATSPNNDIPEPTEAQKLAGNYKVGKITISGLSISIENPKGSTRSGVDADGNKWSNTMQHHYGYINNTEGADGDHLDVFVVPSINEDYQGAVYVVDQVDPLTGDFDEHKVIIGAKSKAEAKRVYLANYDKGWDGLGDLTEFTMADFKNWLKKGDLTKEVGREFEDRYDSIANNNPKEIIAAIRKLMANNTPENARALAEAAGLSIEKPTEPKTTPILNGFTDNMTTLNAGRAKTVLSVKINYGDLGILTRGEFVEQAAQKSIFSKHEIETQRIRAKEDHPDAFYTSRGYMRMTEKTVLSLDGFIITQTEHDYSQYLLKKQGNHFDDIGGFNFEPMVSVDATMQAIKKIMAENTLDNARYLAMITGLTLKEDAPEVELDMFGDPIQSQGFDLFGEPIQDGDDSPVEELPRLAVIELPLSKLTLSEDVPQFKSGADDESGVVEALGGKFDRTGVAPIQVWERTDGRLEIISGRHRTDLARRSGEKTIPAQVHKESEGFTAKQAMMLDAELNIRDGQGKVKDYVDYFTHSEISEDEAERRGLIARSIGQRAFTIASQGSEELKTLHRNDIISDQAAAEIASIAPNNSAMQAVGLRVLQEHKPLNNALNTIRAVQALTREKGQEPDTFDLFGFDDSALKEAEAMARIASRKQRQIAEQLNAIKGAVKNPKLAAKHGVVVENEADALAKVQAMTAQKARWDNWSSHADLLAEVREELNDKFDSLLDDEDDYYWLCQEELAL